MPARTNGPGIAAGAGPFPGNPMKISAQFSFWASIVFAIGCVAYAGFGFSSIEASMTDATREASRGYAWFWLFMGAVGAATALVSWLMLSGRIRMPEE